jgi:hypothetical protein
MTKLNYAENDELSRYIRMLVRESVIFFQIIPWILKLRRYLFELKLKT